MHISGGVKMHDVQGSFAGLQHRKGRQAGLEQPPHSARNTAFIFLPTHFSLNTPLQAPCSLHRPDPTVTPREVHLSGERLLLPQASGPLRLPSALTSRFVSWSLCTVWPVIFLSRTETKIIRG